MTRPTPAEIADRIAKRLREEAESHQEVHGHADPVLWAKVYTAEEIAAEIRRMG